MWDKVVQIIHPPNVDVISLEELKRHLRVESAFEDEYLLGLIKVATEYVESYIGKVLIGRTNQLLASFGGGVGIAGCGYDVELPQPPLLEVVSVCKVSANGKKSSLGDYFVKSSNQRAIISLMPGFSLDYFRDGMRLEVVYRCGFGDYPKQIPAAIRQAVLIKAADFYESRNSADFEGKPGGVLQNGGVGIVGDLLAPYKRMVI